MSLKVFIVLLVSLLSLTFYGKGQSVSVEFIKEGKSQIIDESFEIYFVIQEAGQKTIIQPKIDSSSFTIPNFCDNETADLLVKYKNVCYGLGKSQLAFDQNMKWVIGLDRKPFNREYYIKSAGAASTKGLVYIEFHPLERGEGRVTTVTIMDFKTYFKESENLLY